MNPGTSRTSQAAPIMKLHGWITISLFAGLALPESGVAQTDLPLPIREGLDAYRTPDGCRGAMDVWTRNWTAESDVPKRQSLIAGCRNLVDMGSYHGHDLAHVERLGESVVRTYIVLRYDHQPIYLRLIAYHGPRGWNVVSVNWHTDVEQIFPDWAWHDVPGRR